MPVLGHRLLEAFAAGEQPRSLLVDLRDGKWEMVLA